MNIRRAGALALTGLVVALTLVLVVAPPLAGRQVLTRLEAVLARTASTGGGRLQVLRRERGWFTSVLEARLAIAGYRAQPVRVRLVHGPVHLGMLRVGRSPLVAGYARVHLTGAPRPVAEAELSYDGSWDLRSRHLDVRLDAAPGPVRSPARVTVRGLRVALGFRARSRSLALNAAAEQGEFSVAGVVLQWTDAALLGEYTLDAAGWPFGATSVRVEHLRWPDLDWRLSGADMSAATTDNGDYVTVRLSLRGAGGVIAGQRFGPTVLDAAARRIGRPALGAWASGGMAFGALLAGADLSVTELQVRDQADTVLVGAGATAGYGEPDLRDLELTLDLAVAEAFARSVFRQAAERMLGYEEVFGKLSELDGEEQQAVARASADQQLSVLAAQRYLRLTRGVYNTRLTRRDGEWALNGRPVSVR